MVKYALQREHTANIKTLQPGDTVTKGPAKVLGAMVVDVKRVKQGREFVKRTIFNNEFTFDHDGSPFTETDVTFDRPSADSRPAGVNVESRATFSVLRKPLQ
jgi:hypothetical protein